MSSQLSLLSPKIVAVVAISIVIINSFIVVVVIVRVAVANGVVEWRASKLKLGGTD